MFSFLVVTLLGVASAYKLGTGIYDITGPSVEINFMGYAVPGQRGSGILQRLRSRAFYIGDENSHFVFVSADIGMGSDLVKMRVVEGVNKRLGGEVFTNDNVAISGTHTHSGPAGFIQYTLYQITSWGFVPETFDTFVAGIIESIVQAYENAKDGKILVNQGELEDSNINRSPTSYLLNPEEERAKYNADTDKNMLLLKMVGTDGSDIGMLNWFAVHGTSMNNTNTLVNGDNKGLASYLIEKDMNNDQDITKVSKPYVAAFAATNLGDVSPNTAGPLCRDTGLPCDGETSSCNGKCEQCIAFGPGTNGNMKESATIIATNQYEHAKTLMADATEEISGPVDFRHSFLDMPNLKLTVPSDDGTLETVNLCPAALGYSFAGGTTDGPGMLNFTQGTTTGNPFWDKVADFLGHPTEEEKACQYPKPILFNTGNMDKPYAWDPEILPIQMLRVGNLFIAVPSAEFTTMSGRRLREQLYSQIRESNVIPDEQEIYVTIAGLSNSYSHYVTTLEEYQGQRYEAASTLFGPNTLQGYLQEFKRITGDLLAGRPSETAQAPADLSDEQWSLGVPKVPFDRTPIGKKFGEVKEDVDSNYKSGNTVSATFYAANPRNDQRIQQTYLTVEQKSNNDWTVVRTDGDWDTEFHWQGGPKDPIDAGLSGQSKATVKWEIPSTAETGTYRLCYFGNNKNVKGDINDFSGCSSEFEVIS